MILSFRILRQADIQYEQQVSSQETKCNAQVMFSW